MTYGYTTNDNESEWWLSRPICDSSWTVSPWALFVMVHRFEQEYAAQCSGILCLPLLGNKSMTGPRWRPHFLCPAANVASTLSYVYGVYSFLCLWRLLFLMSMASTLSYVYGIYSFLCLWRLLSLMSMDISWRRLDRRHYLDRPHYPSRHCPIG